jgi:hypothetical protein
VKLVSLPRAAFIALAVALAVTPAALAEPPSNDNRASAQVIPSFPFEVHGTLVEATVERLDPQVSECGSIASTVWYRIEVAPDGIVTANARAAAGVAPVLRLYRQGRSAISEVDCGVAPAGGTATASVETVRGANYFILVGRRPTSADGEFDLSVTLTLPPDPPANDRSAAATRVRGLPATVSGTTVGARSEESDPAQCGLSGGSVWYRLPGRQGLVVLRLQTARNLDAVLVVVERSGARSGGIACRRTTARGAATVAFNARRGSAYHVVVGHPESAERGTFTLRVVAADAPERLARRALPARGVRASLNGLTNPNDLWRLALRPGVGYRIAFASSSCAGLTLRRAGRSAALLVLPCGGYRVFTPGPDGGGRYVLDVNAAASERTQSYRLQVSPVQADDVGIGLPLRSHAVRRGALSPQSVDIIDVYHFDVERQSDVRLTLRGGEPFTLRLVTESGGRLGSGADVRRRLGPGRYVVGVSASPGTPGGSYGLALLVRDITSTTLVLADAELPRGTTLVLRPTVTPAAAGGRIELQIDRFDPFGGWQFFRLLRTSVGSSVGWTPPRAGTWRVRASFLGTQAASPSRSGYVRVTVR